MNAEPSGHTEGKRRPATTLMDSTHAKRSRLPEAEASPISNGGSGEGRNSRDNDSALRGPDYRTVDISGTNNGASLGSEHNANLSHTIGERFACPFFKHDPKYYNAMKQSGDGLKFRACFGPGWLSFKDVKDHLFRRHKAPLYCERCYQEFSSKAEKSEHLRQLESCHRGASRRMDGVTIEQSYRITRELRKCPTEKDKWVKMYQILFPDAAHVPNPYYEDLDSNSDLFAKSDIIVDSILSELGSIVSQSLDEVFASIGHLYDDRTDPDDTSKLDRLKSNLETNLIGQMNDLVRIRVRSLQDP